VAAPGAGIAGWPAYDGERIIGLNTNVPLYVIVQDAARPPVTISAAPEGFAICRSVLRDGYWLAGFAAADTLKAAPAPDAPAEAGALAVRTLRVRSDRPVRFLGAKSVKALSENEYELQVALPGAVGAFWGEPTAVTTGQVVSTLPALYSGHDRLSGLVYHEAQMRPGDLLQPPVGDVPAQEGTVAWLLRLPQQPLRLAFSYGTTHGYGDGANYMVRVNGRELWKAYRRQQSEDPEEAKAHAAPPIPSATVDLAAYAGQTVILELAAMGIKAAAARRSPGGGRSWSLRLAAQID